MNAAHWIFLALTGAMLLMMLAFSLAARPGSAFSRGVKRLFLSYLFLEGAGAFGWIGANGVNWALVAALGWPGAAALTALGWMG